tara:strand:- start:1752 stop:1895 length:144 start_codon:yes stop_codon:yes gene_type:complete
MAGNKFNTKFEEIKPLDYTLKFNVRGSTSIVSGTPKQIINFILNQQL